MSENQNTPITKDKMQLLYVDDEPNNLISFKAAFRRDYKIFTAESGAEGRKILDNNSISIVITDQRMPFMTGVEFLESIVNDYPNTIRILITGFSDIQAVIDAINKGKIYHYVQKPWDETYLRNIISNAFETHRLRRENKFMMEQLKISNEQLEFLLRQEMLS
jgi:response regulator RpfG family c-di-GMP phosphodiesterase